MARKKRNDEDIIKRKPTRTDWDKIIAAYLEGKVEPQDMAAEFPMLDIDEYRVRKKLSLVGAIQQRKAMDDAVIDAIFNVSKEKRMQAAMDCVRLYESGARLIEKMLNKYHTELDTGIRQGKSIATAYNTDMLMSGVTKIQKGFRVAFGEDEKGNLFEKEPEVLTIEGISGDKI